MRFILFIAFSLVMVALAAVFSAANEQLIEIHLFIDVIQTRLSYALFASFVIGLALSWLLCFMIVSKWKWRCRRLNKQLAKLTKQEQVNNES